MDQLTRDDSKTPSVLDYARASDLISRQQSQFGRASFHFIVGAGAGTLLAAVVILSGRPSDYPITLTCGGIFVVVIQWFFLMLPAWCRRLLLGHFLAERNTYKTIVLGLLGAAAIFFLPVLLNKLHVSAVIPNYLNLFSVFVLPVLISFLVFRREQ